MNTKLVKDLKANWAKVSESGGHFLFLFGSWPEDGGPGPILAVHPKREVEPAAVKKLDRSADTTGKRTWGRVVVEEDKSVTFYVATDAHTKAPSILREALKALPDREELRGARLDGLRRATCRLDEQLQQPDNAKVDVEGTKAELGKPSLFRRIVKSGSAKLLARLVRWNDRYGGGLSASNVRAAEIELADLRERCRAWAETRTDDAGRKQADRLKSEVGRARAFLEAFQKSVREDAQADETADTLLGGGDVGTDEAASGRLRDASEKLAGRLALDLDPEERAFVGRKLAAVAERSRVGMERLEARLQSGETPPLLAARRDLRLGLAHELGARIRGLEGEVSEELQAEALTIGEGLCDEVRRSTRSDQVAPVARTLLDTAHSLEEHGGDPGPLVSALAKVGAEMSGAQYRAAKGDLGSLGRSNSPVSALRSAFTQRLGQEFADAILERPRMLMAVHPNLGTATITEETDPGVLAKFERLRRINDAMAATVTDAREQLVDAARAILGLDASFRDALLAAARNGGELRLGRATGLGAPITARAFAADAVGRSEEVRRGVVQVLRRRAEPFLATRITLDPDPVGTTTQLEAHLDARLKAGAMDLDEALLGFNPPHWERSELSPETLSGMLEDGGHLAPPLDEEQERLVEEAEERARGRYAAAEHVQSTELADVMRETLELSPTFTAIVEAFEAVMDGLLEDPAAIPEEIRDFAARSVAEARAAGLGDRGAELALTDLLVLRWIAPLVFVSGGTGVSVSALIQFVANRQTPNDHRLLPYVPVIERYTVRYDQFVRELLRLLEGGED